MESWEFAEMESFARELDYLYSQLGIQVPTVTLLMYIQDLIHIPNVRSTINGKKANTNLQRHRLGSRF